MMFSPLEGAAGLSTALRSGRDDNVGVMQAKG
jgi:hypothetical protein